MRQLAWLCLALGFLALGADAYWCWKAEGWTYRPIAFYVQLADPGWTARLRHSLVHPLADIMETVASWPVWAVAFGFGAVVRGLAEADRTPGRARR